LPGVNADTALPVVSFLSKSLLLRLVSALVLAPLVLVAVGYGAFYYGLLLVAMGGVLLAEWAAMVRRNPVWMGAGVIYIAAALAALWYLRQDPEWGTMTIFWMLVVVWGADTGGYVFGLSLGGPKLAPAISPNKTWSGFVGGTVLGAVAGWAMVSYFRPEVALDMAGIKVAGLSAALAVVSQAGDLLESWVKRRFGVKDSGTIIPGHGGLFDRVDGLVAAAIVLALINIGLQGNVVVWLS